MDIVGRELGYAYAPTKIEYAIDRFAMEVAPVDGGKLR
jgi:hypothetical protein